MVDDESDANNSSLAFMAHGMFFIFLFFADLYRIFCDTLDLDHCEMRRSASTKSPSVPCVCLNRQNTGYGWGWTDIGSIRFEPEFAWQVDAGI